MTKIIIFTHVQLPSSASYAYEDNFLSQSCSYFFWRFPVPEKYHQPTEILKSDTQLNLRVQYFKPSTWFIFLESWDYMIEISNFLRLSRDILDVSAFTRMLFFSTLTTLMKTTRMCDWRFFVCKVSLCYVELST